MYISLIFILYVKKNSKFPFIHAKVFLIDGKIAVLGSIKEVYILTVNEKVVQRIQEIYNCDWDRINGE
jgi:hypothetical protein